MKTLISAFLFFILISSQFRFKIAEKKDFPKCLDSREMKFGKEYVFPSRNFLIDFPETFSIQEDDISVEAYDSLVGVKDLVVYKILGSMQSERQPGGKPIDGFLEVVKNDPEFKFLDHGEIALSRYQADWLAAENLEDSKSFNGHLMLMIFVDINKHTFLISLESYGEKRFDNICEAKKILNTFGWIDKDVNVKGRELFMKNCAACHAWNMTVKSTGPALGGITKKRDQKWLYDFTRNSQQMIAEGDEEAIKIFEEYNRLVMTPYPNLTDEDLKNIYDYIEETYQKNKEK